MELEAAGTVEFEPLAPVVLDILLGQLERNNMTKLMTVAAAIVAMAASGCGATTRTASTPIQRPAAPALTSATATFISRDDGKDRDSGLTVQLLRSNAELAAEVRGTGFKFDDHSSSGPFGFAMTGPFWMTDIDDSNVRIRLIPDGRDDWTFDMDLVMRFDNGSTRNFGWKGIGLDNAEPERTLALGPALLR